MPTPTTRRPERPPAALPFLIVIAAAATLPLGCAAPAWRNTLCAAAALGCGFLWLRALPLPTLSGRFSFPALASLPPLLGLQVILAGAGFFPDATAVTEAFSFRIAFAAFAITAVGTLRDPGARRIVAAAAALTATLQIVFGLFAHDPLAASSVTSSGRLRGTFSSGNSLGSFLALVLPMLAGWLARFALDHRFSVRRLLHDMQNGQVRRFLPFGALVAAMLVVTTGLLLTASRGALLATLAGTALALSPHLRRKNRFLRLAIPAGIAAICAILMFTGGRFSAAGARWETLVSPGETLGRPAIWQSLLPLLDHHPLGVGMGGLRVVAHTVQPATPTAHRLLEAHNDPLELILEFGLIPGLVLLTALSIILLPPLLQTPSGEPGLRAGMAGAVLAALLHSLVDFNLLWRPGVTFWFLLCLGGILPTRPRNTTPPTRTPRLVVLVPFAAAATSALLAIQHFRSEWWREKAGGRRDAAMVWPREPVGFLDTMPIPGLSLMTADAAARMGSAWLTLRDRLDREAITRDTTHLSSPFPVIGTFFARQFRWSEHTAEYDALAGNANRLLHLAPGNTDLRLVRDTAATRAWLTSPTDRPAPTLPSNPDTTTRLTRIRAAYASLWIDRCRRSPSDLPIARRWIESLPPTHSVRLLLEEQNADLLAGPP